MAEAAKGGESMSRGKRAIQCAPADVHEEEVFRVHAQTALSECQCLQTATCQETGRVLAAVGATKTCLPTHHSSSCKILSILGSDDCTPAKACSPGLKLDCERLSHCRANDGWRGSEVVAGIVILVQLQAYDLSIVVPSCILGIDRNHVVCARCECAVAEVQPHRHWQTLSVPFSGHVLLKDAAILILIRGPVVRIILPLLQYSERHSSRIALDTGVQVGIYDSTPEAARVVHTHIHREFAVCLERYYAREGWQERVRDAHNRHCCGEVSNLAAVVLHVNKCGIEGDAWSRHHEIAVCQVNFRGPGAHFHVILATACSPDSVGIQIHKLRSFQRKYVRPVCRQDEGPVPARNRG
mmetsp:Transcript_25387/g.59569  ORF Transcript_25387/g.59569 Transcript_25387/m.59569 type:complete len:354 (+) Transcript_25387:1080-2141(+)